MNGQTSNSASAYTHTNLNLLCRWSKTKQLWSVHGSGKRLLIFEPFCTTFPGNKPCAHDMSIMPSSHHDCALNGFLPSQTAGVTRHLLLLSMLVNGWWWWHAQVTK
jgi:hypothetical protein